MKKRFVGILAVFMLVFSGFIFTSCGNKYKNLSFSVEYAYSEDASEWYDGTSGILCTYGAEDDELKLAQGENYVVVYVRVNVKGVKAKNIGRISVSKAVEDEGLDFNGANIKNGQVFSFKVYNKTTNALRVIETNSKREIEVDISVQKSITGLSATNSVLPAVVVGNSINLKSINNLVYTPSDTSQTEVRYELDAIGRIDEKNKFISATAGTLPIVGIGGPTINATTFADLDLNGDVLLIKNTYKVEDSGKHYNVIRIKAVSTANEEITTYFYVYVVDAVSGGPSFTFNEGHTFDDFSLYVGSDSYSSTTLTIGDSNLSKTSPTYCAGANTENGQVKFVRKIKVDGQLYELGRTESINGLRIEENAGGLKFIATSQVLNEEIVNGVSVYNSRNNVKVYYEIDGLTFFGGKPNFSTSFNISKKLLPTGVSVVASGSPLEFDGSKIATGDLYTSSSVTDRGMRLDLSIVPTDTTSDDGTITIIDENDNFYIKGSNNVELSGTDYSTNGKQYVVRNRAIVYVKFKGNSSTASLKFQVVTTPDKFAGTVIKPEYATYTYTLTKKIVADNILFYSDASLTNQIQETDIVYLASGSETKTKIYAKMIFGSSNTKENVDTPVLSFSNSEFSSSNAKLNDAIIINSFTKYSVYEITLDNPNAAGKTGRLTLTSQSGNIGTTAGINIKSVNVETNPDDNITVSLADNQSTENSVYIVNKNNNQYIIEKSKEIQFRVNGNVANVTCTSGLTDGANVDFNFAGAGDYFTITGRHVLTTARNIGLRVEYFTQDTNSGVVSKTTTDRSVQLAIFEPVTTINLTYDRSELNYVNSKCTTYSTAHIGYSVNTVTEFAFDKGKPSEFSRTFAPSVALKIDDLENAASLSVDNFNSLTGNAVLALNKEITKDITLTASFELINGTEILGNVVTKEIVFKAKPVDKATGIEISSDKLTTNVAGGQEIELSFLGVSDATQSVDLNARVLYATTNSSNIRFNDYDISVKQVAQNFDGSYQLADGKIITTDTLTTFAYNKVGDKITITSTRNGGVYELKFAPIDSYDDSKGFYDESKTITIYLRVTDGSQKNPFVLRSSTDFSKINDNMSSNYVLGENVDLGNISADDIIGGDTLFSGTLSGKYAELSAAGSVYYTMHSLTYTVAATKQVGGMGATAGLFTRLEGAIKDIKVNAKFKFTSLSQSETNGGLYIGALAGDNIGTIENVEFHVLESNIIIPDNLGGLSVNFGGLVGGNGKDGAKIGKILGCTIVYDGEVTITSETNKTHNIGFVAGVNAGTIEGKYEGKKSFANAITYDVQGSLDIVSTSANDTNNKFYFGGIAGDNSGTIQGLNVTGLATISGEEIGCGYIAGIAGISTHDITTVATVGLDLTSESESVAVGGLVGSLSSGKTLTDGRVISIYNEDYDAYGILTGAGTVAGAVASNEGAIEKVAVESFVERNTIIGKNVYGLCSGGTAKLSFVNANVEVLTDGTINLTTDGANSNTYFIGKVAGVTVSSTNATYAVIVGDAISELGNPDDISVVNNISNVQVAGSWLIDDNHNVVNDKSYPYLAYKDNQNNIVILMIEKPTALNFDIVDDETIGQDDHPRESELILNEGDITTTAVVNFYETSTASLEELNSHYLLDTNETDPTNGHDGLAILHKVPENAIGGVVYRIIQGSQFAYLKTVDGEIKIVFLGRSVVRNGSEYKNVPIVVECYSAFDPSVREYLVFYTEYGINKDKDGKGIIELKSSSFTTISNVPTIVTYLGNIDASLVELQIKNSKDEYQALNAYNANATFTIESGYDNNKLVITQSGNSRVEVKLKDDLTTIDGDNITENVTLKLYMTKQADGAYGINQKILLGEATFNVLITKSAMDVTVNSSDHSVYESKANINFGFDLTTGFVHQGGFNEITFGANVVNDEIVVVPNPTMDRVKVSFDVIEGQEELVRLMSQANVTTIAALFDAKVVSVNYNNDKTYSYQMSIALKDRYEYRYLTSNIKLRANIIAESNEDIFDSFTFELKPTKITTMRIQNFSATDSIAKSDYTKLITGNYLESSVIAPGGHGGIMVIYLEPAYAYVEEAKLISTEVQGNYMTFTQLYKNSEDKYVSIYPANDTIKVGDKTVGSYLNLDPTYSVEKQGTYFVLVTLDAKVIATESIVSATLTADNKSVARHYITQYLPGVSLDYDGIETEDGYLIEDKTYNYVDLQIFGADRTSSPTATIRWNLKNTNKFNYVDGNQRVITDGTNNYNINDYVDVYITTNPESQNDKYANYNVGVKLQGEVPTNFSIEVSATIGKDTSTEKIDFCPTKYVIKSIHVAGLTNSSMTLLRNRSKQLMIEVETANSYVDYSNEIYKEIITSGIKFDELFSYVSGNNTVLFSNEQDKFKINTTTVNEDKYYNLLAQDAGVIDAKFSIGVKYEYENGKYVIKYEGNGSKTNVIEDNFTLKIYAGTTEDTAIAIYSQQELLDNIAEGVDLILMRDIELENFTPITTHIGSLDGNNKVITIKSFAIPTTDETVNVGLFAETGEFTREDGSIGKTILKNVIVDYGRYSGGKIQLTQNFKNITFGGLVAQNGGLIYNCDIMNVDPSTQTSTTKTLQIQLDSLPDVNIVFGGLVGENGGVITNSRVGRSSYTKISMRSTGAFDTTDWPAGKLKFIIGTEDQENVFVATAGGFVGRNDGTITSSYIANTALISYSTNVIQSKTAGFVGENIANADIIYSYARGDESVLSSTHANASSEEIIIKGMTDGRIGGFVHTNSGSISNTYANVSIESDSIYIAGFVYKNDGTISTSYAASTLNGVLSGSNDAERPFSGIGTDGKVQGSGTWEHCYFLNLTNDSLLSRSGDEEPAVGMNSQNFMDENNLNGFVFVLGNSTDREEGVWSYQTVGNNPEKRILPELMTAAKVAHSYRYEVETTNDEVYYEYAANYYMGSKNNPYIIRSATEFNNMFAPGGADSNNGYFRLIDNISFVDSDSNSIAIKTSSGYTLGDAAGASFEGNGLTISNIEFQAETGNTQSVGLFATLKNAFIKNLNLEFKDFSPSSTNVICSGGLAGVIENGAIFNIRLNGANTIITGNNLVGGLAGLIKGSTLLYGIESNLSAISGQSSSSVMYQSNATPDQLKLMSYAGGIAGVIDTRASGINYIDYNMVNISVNGNEMSTSSTLPYNISGAYAGGVAGFIGKDVNALRVKYNVGTSDRIKGQTAVGGLFGVSLGSITASQVTAPVDVQLEIDTEIGNFINSDSVSELSTDSGNLNLLEGYKYGGGLVGVGIGTTIKASYSKATFTNQTLTNETYKNSVSYGGLVGLATGGAISYSYAVPIIQATAYLGNASGLIAVASETATINGETMPQYATRVGKTIAERKVSVEHTFSSVIINGTLDPDTNVAHISADGKNNIVSNGTASLSYAFVGTNKTVTEAKETAQGGQNQQLAHFYDLNQGQHETTFATTFTNWESVGYWGLDSNKYFPLLVDQNNLDYIIIHTADDFNLLLGNPTASYMIDDDIDMSVWCNNLGKSNWVFNTTFTGTLVGRKQDGTTPTVYGLYLKPSTEGASCGLFKETVGVSISGIDWIWSSDKGEAPIQLGSNVGVVGLISCHDENSTYRASTFSNLRVGVVNTTVGQIQSIIEANTTHTIHTIGGFGAIVGEGYASKIESCSFNGSLYANLTNDANVGGLAGKLDSGNDESHGDTLDLNPTIRSGGIWSFGLSKSKSSVQSAANIINFDLTLNGDANIGGIAGCINTGSITGAMVGIITTDDPNVLDESKAINFNISGNTGNLNFGGAVGQDKDAYIFGVQANTSVNKELSKPPITRTLNISTSANFAGLVGSASIINIKTPTLTDAKDEAQIRQSNTLFNLDASNLVADNVNVNVACGVATYASAGSISQCLFNGEITANGTSIYAGGAVADAKNLIITETMTKAVMTLGSPKATTIVAGGFIGQVDGLNMKDCAAIGRILPEVRSIGELNDEFIIGGLVGNVTSGKIKSSYTLVSILSEKLNANSLAKLDKINALIGSGSVEANADVIFSTDYNLANENSDHVTNISGQAFVGENKWYENADIKSEWNVGNRGEDQTWSVFTDNSAPYITSLGTALNDFGWFATTDQGTYYVLGLPLNPVKNTTDLSSSEYKYYMFTDDSALSVLGNVDKGILIFGDNAEYKSRSIATLIGAISSGSAVSNLHADVTVNNAKDNVASVLVGTNNGTMFNCSMIGSIGSQNNEVNRQLGLLTETNAGAMVYCYSSADVTATSQIGGIAYENSGVIASSYFTGCLDTSGDGAGAMVFTNKIDENNGLIYNCYNAGIVTNFNTTEGSFVGDENTGIIENSFIDKFANGEDSGIETASLMANLDEVKSNGKDLLIGKWATCLNNSGYFIRSGNGTTFGYNYGYPVPAFRKVAYIGSKWEEANNTLHQRETGNSTSDKPFEVQHAGLLQAVQGLLVKGQETGVVVTSKDEVNVMLTRNIVYMNNEDTPWKAVGSRVGSTVDVKYTKQTNMNGFYADVNTTLHGIINGNNKTISGLHGQGLFANISEATINDLTFGTFGDGTNKSLNNSGVIGTNVIGDVELKSISFATDAEIYMRASSIAGALFEKIAIEGTGTKDKLTIKGIKDSDKLTIVAQNSVKTGLIAGKITSGDVVLDYYQPNENENIFEQNKFSTTVKVLGDNVVVGGFVGEISGGTISAVVDDKKTDGTKICTTSVTTTMEYDENIASAEDYPTLSSLGGIVGKAGSAAINNINAELEISQTYMATNFGGLVALVTGDVTFTSCSFKCGSTDKCSIANNENAGLAAGKIESSATLTLVKTTLASKDLEFAYDSNINDSNINTRHGALVGYLDGNLNSRGKINKDDTSEQIVKIFGNDVEINGKNNVGAIAGHYKSGKVDIDNFGTAITIKGNKNVGGVFGKVEGELIKTEQTENDVYELSTDSTAMADLKYYTIEYQANLNPKILTDDIAKVQGKENVGGLFGILSADIDGSKFGIDPSVDKGKLTNHNTLSILIDKNGTSTREYKDASNFGGIAGLFTGSSASNLANAAGLFAGLDNDININNVDGTINIQLSNSGVKCLPTNVGGIFGQAVNAYIYNVSTTAETHGYQNVGSVVGYANGTNVGEATIIVKLNADDTLKKGVDYYSLIEGFVDGESGRTPVSIYQKVTGDDRVNKTNDYTVTSSDNIYAIQAATDYTNPIQFTQVFNDGAQIQLEEVEVTPITINTNVTGVINVGGIVGYADNGATIKATYTGDTTEAKVSGNTNVGGIVGSANGATIDGSNVGTSTINAVYFKATDTINNGNIVYIPTSVGGVAGYVTGGSITDTHTHDTSITSTDEGKNNTTISTVSNNMLNAGSVNNSTKIPSADDVMKFDEIKSGFGGFVGTTNTGVTMSNNSMTDPTVSAQLGVNVGTFFGYIQGIGNVLEKETTNDNTFGSITLPTLISNNTDDSGRLFVSVGGGYNIGGIVGYLDVNGAYNRSFITTKIKREEGTDNNLVTVKIQNNNEVGIYVGGLFGKVSAKQVENLTLDNRGPFKIEINTSGSYKMGGLVGLWDAGNSDKVYFGCHDGAPDDKNAIVEQTDANSRVTTSPIDDNTETPKIDNINSAAEFGGLIGMVKVGKKSGGVTVNISGTHFYPFTVNTIENENYDDGTAKTRAYVMGDSLFLAGSANYENKDKFYISKVSSFEYNPLHGQGSDSGGHYGWNANYSRFKTLQRCIHQENAMTGDSKAVLYDAANIVAITNDYIIYEEAQGSMKMYTKKGIAAAYVTPYKFTAKDDADHESAKYLFGENTNYNYNYTFKAGDYAIPQKINSYDDTNKEFINDPNVNENEENLLMSINGNIYITDVITDIGVYTNSLVKVDSINDLFRTSYTSGADQYSEYRLTFMLKQLPNYGYLTFYPVSRYSSDQSIDLFNTSSGTANEKGLDSAKNNRNAVLKKIGNTDDVDKKNALKRLIYGDTDAYPKGIQMAGDLANGFMAPTTVHKLSTNSYDAADWIKKGNYKYYYYSDVRPSNFYSEKDTWKSGSDWISGTYNGSNKGGDEVHPTFVFEKGAYFISEHATKVYYERTQAINLSNYTPAQYYKYNGEYYTYDDHRNGVSDATIPIAPNFYYVPEPSQYSKPDSYTINTTSSDDTMIAYINDESHTKEQVKAMYGSTSITIDGNTTTIGALADSYTGEDWREQLIDDIRASATTITNGGNIAWVDNVDRITGKNVVYQDNSGETFNLSSSASNDKSYIALSIPEGSHVYNKLKTTNITVPSNPIEDTSDLSEWVYRNGDGGYSTFSGGTYTIPSDTESFTYELVEYTGLIYYVASESTTNISEYTKLVTISGISASINLTIVTNATFWNEAILKDQHIDYLNVNAPCVRASEPVNYYYYNEGFTKTGGSLTSINGISDISEYAISNGSQKYHNGDTIPNGYLIERYKEGKFRVQSEYLASKYENTIKNSTNSYYTRYKYGEAEKYSIDSLSYETKDFLQGYDGNPKNDKNHFVVVVLYSYTGEGDHQQTYYTINKNRSGAQKAYLIAFYPSREWEADWTSKIKKEEIRLEKVTKLAKFNSDGSTFEWNNLSNYDLTLSEGWDYVNYSTGINGYIADAIKCKYSISSALSTQYENKYLVESATINFGTIGDPS